MDHVYASREKHGHSKAVQAMIDLALDYVPNAERVYKEGGEAVWIVGVASMPLIYACGVLPVVITEVGRFGSEDAVHVTEEEFQVPVETCAMVKATIGEFYKKKDYAFKRLIYSSTVCEPFNQCFELVKDFGYEPYIMDLGFRPFNKDRERYLALKKIYTDEYRKLALWLGKGRIDEDRLRVEIHRYNRIQKKIRSVLSLRRQHCTYMQSLPTMLMLAANAHYYGQPEKFEDALDDIIEEMTALPPGAYDDAKVRVVWTGQRGQEFSVYETIDDAKAAVTGWVLPNNWTRRYDETLSPFDSVIDFVIGNEAAGKTEDKCRLAERQLELTGAKGMLLYTYQGCSFGTIDEELERIYFHQKDIATLPLVGSYQVGAPTGQTITRIRAFLEMLA